MSGKLAAGLVAGGGMTNVEHPSLISAEKCGGTQQIAVTPSRQSGLIIVTLLLTGDQVPRAHHRQSSYRAESN